MKLGVKKQQPFMMAILTQKGWPMRFAEPFKELGGEIVAFEAEAPDASNVEPLLTTVAAAGPEFIFYPVLLHLGSLSHQYSQGYSWA